MLGVFGPKSGKIGLYKGAVIYQGPFKEDFCAGSPAINEVVLEEASRKSNFRFTEFSEVQCSPGPTPMGVPPSDRSYMLTICVCSSRVRTTPFSSHSPPAKRWLSREVPAIGHGDRCDGGPQHSGPHEVIGHLEHPCCQRREDSIASYETHVHEHRN